MKYKRLTEKDLEEIYRLFVKEHWTDEELSERYERPVRSIKALRIYHGITRRGKLRTRRDLVYHRWTSEELERLRHLYVDEGLHDKQIAEIFGREPVQVTAARKYAGIARPLKMTYDAMRQRMYRREKARQLFIQKFQNNGKERC